MGLEPGSLRIAEPLLSLLLTEVVSSVDRKKTTPTVFVLGVLCFLVSFVISDKFFFKVPGLVLLVYFENSRYSKILV